MPVSEKVARAGEGVLERFTKENPEAARSISPVLTGLYLAKPGERAKSTAKGVGAHALGWIPEHIISKVIAKKFGISGTMAGKIVRSLPGSLAGGLTTYVSGKALQAKHEKV